MSDFLRVEKYRPKNIEHCILPPDVKSTFKSFVEQGEIPNLLLSGTAGVGKTTIAKALCNELGADFYVINGSDEGRFLDTVRNNAKNFASTVSLSSEAKHKVVIIDEADNMIGVVDVRDALDKAKDVGLDLVEVSPDSDPPVCRILDFGKYLVLRLSIPLLVYSGMI